MYYVYSQIYTQLDNIAYVTNENLKRTENISTKLYRKQNLVHNLEDYMHAAATNQPDALKSVNYSLSVNYSIPTNNDSIFKSVDKWNWVSETKRWELHRDWSDFRSYK